MSNRTWDKKYIRTVTWNHSGCVIHCSMIFTHNDSTTKTTAEPRGSSQREPTSLYSANTNGRVKGDKEVILCWRCLTQGPSAHLLLHTLRH
ncbi:hypothetical protein Hanom_Chr02g00116331 [Helianthus anomalus]